MPELGRRLRAERAKRDLTCDMVAQALGTNKGEISRYENGIKTPNAAVLGALADIFMCSTDYLLGRSAQRTIPLHD